MRRWQETAALRDCDHRVQLPMLGGWQVRVEILVNDFEKISLEDRIELLR
jgi:hypothetical protein